MIVPHNLCELWPELFAFEGLVKKRRVDSVSLGPKQSTHGGFTRLRIRCVVSLIAETQFRPCHYSTVDGVGFVSIQRSTYSAAVCYAVVRSNRNAHVFARVARRMAMTLVTESAYLTKLQRCFLGLGIAAVARP